MPALANVSLNDRETTPVAHLFVPRDVNDKVGLLVRTSGVPVGEERLTITSRKSGAKFRSKLTLAVPIVVNETINGVISPKVVRTAYASVEFTFDETSSLQERTNVAGMIADSLATSKTMIHNTLVGLEGVYGS